MDRKEILNHLNDFEKAYPVEKWVINGLNIWPLIKIDTFFRHISWENRDNNLPPREAKKVNILKRLALSLLAVIRLFLKKTGHKKDVLFFCESKGHRQWYKGTFINKYFQPFFEQTDPDTTECYTITDDNYSKEYSGRNTIFIKEYLPIISAARTVFKRKIQSSLPDFDQFIAIFSEYKHLSIGRDYKSHLIQMVNSILDHTFVVRMLLGKYKPKAIFELCYYSISRYAFNFSVHGSDIPTIELQHGGMGKGHVSYDTWYKFPQEGYNIFPKVFWTWDKASFELINDWIKTQKRHKVILGGNPWTGYVLNADEGKYDFPKEKKIIVYTLQYSTIDDYIISAIKETPETFEWWIRLHPRKQEAKLYISQKLISEGIIDKVEIDKACSFPLPVILKNSVIHISGSSGSIIEAAQLGKYSIVIEEEGLDYYRTYIDNGIAIPEISQSPEKILEKILYYSDSSKAATIEDINCIKIFKDIISKQNCN